MVLDIIYDIHTTTYLILWRGRLDAHDPSISVPKVTGSPHLMIRQKVPQFCIILLFVQPLVVLDFFLELAIYFNRSCLNGHYLVISRQFSFSLQTIPALSSCFA